MKTEGKSSFTSRQLIGKLWKVAISFGSWALPVVVLLLLFIAVGLVTQEHHPVLQRIYTYF